MRSLEKMVRTLILICVVLNSWHGLCNADDFVPSVSQPRWMIEESRKLGFVCVAPRVQQFHIGSTVEIDITFTSRVLEEFLNPFWEMTADLPGFVAVFNSQQQFIGFLTNSPVKSSTNGPSIRLQVSDTAGTRLTVSTGDETILGSGDQRRLIQTLGPGKYSVQAIYTDRFLRPDADGTAMAASELATIEVLRPTDSSKEATAVLDNPKLGRAEVIIPKKEFRIEDRMRFEIRYTNTTGRPISVFNAFGRYSNQPRGSGLFVSVNPDEPLEDVNYAGYNSHGGYSAWDFMTLPPNAIAGTQNVYIIALGTLKRRTRSSTEFPQCYLRAAYTDFFFTKSPFGEHSEISPSKWYEKYHDSPVLVSEPVKITYPSYR